MKEHSDAKIEQEIQSLRLTAPRVTLHRICESMEKVEYKTYVVEGTTTTHAVALLDGFSLATGVSACVDPRNFNEELGRTYAIRDAKEKAHRKLWELEGYLLANTGDCGKSPAPSFIDRLLDERAELSKKYLMLKAALDNKLHAIHHVKAAADLAKGQAEAMFRYYQFLDRRIDFLTKEVGSIEDVERHQEQRKEQSVEPLDSHFFDFGKAVRFAKQGKKIARKGWNGKGMYAVLMNGYPNGVPANKETAKKHGIDEGQLIAIRPYYQLFTAQGDVAAWAPSGSDTLAEDWFIYE